MSFNHRHAKNIPITNFSSLPAYSQDGRLSVGKGRVAMVADTDYYRHEAKLMDSVVPEFSLFLSLFSQNISNIQT